MSRHEEGELAWCEMYDLAAPYGSTEDAAIVAMLCAVTLSGKRGRGGKETEWEVLDTAGSPLEPAGTASVKVAPSSVCLCLCCCLVLFG